MKVILLRDVAKLGKRFSVIEVPDGYALNQLIPKGMAEAATSLNLKRVEARKEKVSHGKADELSTFHATLKTLEEKTLTLEVVANEQEHLFKTVKNTDIAALLATAELAVPLTAIIMAEPIKALGTYDIPLEFSGVKGSVKVAIVSK